MADELEEMMQDYCLLSVSDSNPAFRLQLDIYLMAHGLDPEIKFFELPRCAQSEICRKAAIEIRVPVN